MTRHNAVALGVLLVSGMLTACTDSQELAAPLAKAAGPQAAIQAAHSQPAPAPLTTVTFGGRHLTLWPYTADAIPAIPVDPINLLFPGRTPIQVRAALLTLDGNRAPAFPNAAPFNCVWKDAAAGGDQEAYSNEGGWAGSAIQLTCGDFTIRYHLRLFSAGDWTMGGAHFEVQIPGVPNHQPLSWDRAQELVIFDLMRSGFLDASVPMAPLPTGSETPYYRTIDPRIYYPLAQAEPALAAYIQANPVDQNLVQIPNDGYAMALNLASVPPIKAMTASQEFTLQMGQIVPKPFCSTGPADYVQISGPMHVTERVVVTPGGSYSNTSFMEVKLDVVQFDPIAGQPVGTPYKGLITDLVNGSIAGPVQFVAENTTQTMYPSAPGRGTQSVTLRVGPGDSSGYSKVESCSH